MTDQAARARDIQARLDAQPRVRLGSFPTPLEQLPRLSEQLGVRVLVKRDDLSGLAFGGNKTRTLEYVLGDLVRHGPEVLVTGANIQSNWSRQSAAAAAKLGIPIVLVLRNTDMKEIQGNVLLDLWLGADVRFVDEPDLTNVIEDRLDQVVAELQAQGKRAMKLDPWADSAAFGYVGAALELHAQCEAAGIQPTRIWTAAAGPTQSGLLLGARALEWPVRVTGIAPIHWLGDSMAVRTADAANRASAVLGLGVTIAADEVETDESYIGPGYARPSEAGLAAMRRVARADALLLDPVYTGKAMSALIDQVERGVVTSDETIVFLHTGGLPALFAYRDAVEAMATAGR